MEIDNLTFTTCFFRMAKSIELKFLKDLSIVLAIPKSDNLVEIYSGFVNPVSK